MPERLVAAEKVILERSILLALVAPLNILEKSVVLAKVASGMEMVVGSSIFEHTTGIFRHLLKVALLRLIVVAAEFLNYISGIFSVFEGGITEVDIFKHGTLKN